MQQVGQERHGVARFDEAHLRLEVGRLVAHVGFEPGAAAGLQRPVPRRRALRLEHPGELRGVCEPSHRVERAGADARRGEAQPNAVGDQGLPVEAREARRRVPRVLLGDHEVEAPGPRLLEPGLGFVLHHLDPQTRVRVAQPPEHLRHEREQGGLEHGDAHGAPDLGVRAVQRRLRALEPGQQVVRLGDQHLGGGGQFERATRPAQQRHSRLAFEQRELLRDRRRAVVQRFGDGRDGAARVELPEQAQALHLEHAASRFISSTSHYSTQTVAVLHAPPGSD